MKKLAMVIGFTACLLSLLLATGVTQAKSLDKQAELVASCQKIQQSLTLPAGTSADQRALVALNIAVGQSQPLDGSVDVAGVLRQTSAFTTYGVQSDTFYLWQSDHWEGSHRSTNTYSGGRLTTSVEQDWDGANWVNASKTITAYNVDGTLNTTTMQEWQTDQWVNSFMTTAGYSGGVMTTMLMQTWSVSTWENLSRSTFTYSGGHLATTVTESWVSSAWVNASKSMYTYTGDNLTEWIMQNWVSSAWVNSMRSTMTYNGSGWETESIMYSWQASAWTASSKYEYSYNGSGHEILRVSSDWVVSAWNAMEADTSKWSGDDEIEMVHNHFADGSLSRTQFSYDANHNGILDLGQIWLGGLWVNASRAVYVYEALAVEVDNGRVPSAFELKQNYPNPFNPMTVIRYGLSRPSQVEIVVFNLLGQEVKTLENGLQSAGVYETTWDGTNQTGEKVSSGIYFYRIKAGENIETRKMLLLK